MRPLLHTCFLLTAALLAGCDSSPGGDATNDSGASDTSPDSSRWDTETDESGCVDPPDLLCDAGAIDRGAPDGPEDSAPDGPASDITPDGPALDIAHDGPALDIDARDGPRDSAPDVPSDTAPPDLPAPDTAPPDLPAPDTAPPDLLAPDTVPPDLLAPDTVPPDLLAPDVGSSPCPAGMVLFGKKLCVDRYEASRADATATTQGVQTGAARSAPGVIPWFSSTLTRAEAAAACAAAGKRLCEAAEWKAACSGTKKTVYGYGDLYEPATCNGIDTYCLCGPGHPCAGASPCPYPHCFSSCGASLRIAPTGSHLGCHNGSGAYDMNGNVWELVDSSDGLDHFRGGAYNCINSEALHRCDHDATWGPTARGFRCCADPIAHP